MKQEKGLTSIVRTINEDLANRSSMSVGKKLKHPDGRCVKITSGCFLDPVFGRVSNFWTWREVKRNGKLGKPESGYGW